MNKEKKLTIRFTKEQLEIISEKSGGKSLSRYCRECIMNESFGGSSVATALINLRREFSSIGNNLNQIAKQVNSGDVIKLDELKELIEMLREKTNDSLLRVK